MGGRAVFGLVIIGGGLTLGWAVLTGANPLAPIMAWANSASPSTGGSAPGGTKASDPGASSAPANARTSGGTAK